MNKPTELLGTLFLQSTGITTDSRSVKPGNIFFALKGEKFDGNLYAAQALESGAMAVVVDNPEVVAGESFILVENTLTALQDLARWYRRQLSCPVIGITGSNGKTTTKELIAAVLNTQFSTEFTRGNLNNHLGVPLTLLRIPLSAEMAVIEMGANHPGEIDFLSRIAKPTHGIITNIGKAHLEGFGGFEGVVRTKTELYRYLRETTGTAFVNGSDNLLMQHSEGLNRIVYNDFEAAIRGEVLSDEGLLKIGLLIKNQYYTVQTQLVGGYNLPNMLAAASIGHFMGVTDENIVKALESYVPTNNRSQWLETPKNRVILDAYNANPSSMQAALLNFMKQPHRPKAVILGEMLELGADSSREHAEIARLAESGGFDKIWFTGAGFRDVKQGTWFENTAELKDYLRQNPLQGYLILVKGSRGNHLEEITDVL
ncbi:MAG: UDP-N-acetylmuramoyl-tripeptide--D-alanyl-D-alanine ligase [Bacteroidales bacterium]